MVQDVKVLTIRAVKTVRWMWMRGGLICRRRSGGGDVLEVGTISNKWVRVVLRENLEPESTAFASNGEGQSPFRRHFNERFWK